MSILDAIPYDKKWHIGAGIVLGLSAFVIGQYALALVWGVGVGKEFIYDKLMGKGTCEIMDAIATVVPGSAVAAIILYL